MYRHNKTAYAGNVLCTRSSLSRSLSKYGCTMTAPYSSSDRHTREMYINPRRPLAKEKCSVLRFIRPINRRALPPQLSLCGD